MKDFIVVIALIILGVFIAKLILDDNGLKGTTKSFMQGQVARLGD